MAWRSAKEEDEEAIVRMCQALYAEDPSPLFVSEEQTRETLLRLRCDPARGCPIVLEVKEEIAGYALLISFWSNELGGEIIVIDELYIRPEFRGQGYASALFELLREPNLLWPRAIAALELEVTPANERAAALYSRAGFQPIKNRRLRLHAPRR